MADGVLGRLGPLDDLHDDLVAVLGVLQPLLGDEDVVGQRAAFGEQEGVVLVDLQLADEGVVGAFEYLDDFALALAVLSPCEEGDTHGVIVHGVGRVAFSDEDGRAAVVGQQGILAVALALERAGHDLVRILQLEMSFLRFAEEIVLHHFLEDVRAKHLQGVRIQLQFGADTLHADAFVGLELEQVSQFLDELFLGHSLAGLFFFLLFFVFLSHNIQFLKIKRVSVQSKRFLTIVQV